MKLFRTLISLEEALKTVLSHAKRTEIEEIRLEDALNRVLAEDVLSPIDNPPFDRAAMDGYAIRGVDSFGASPQNPLFLKIKKRDVVREEGNHTEIEEGECVPIATGMPMPRGSNAVVMLEYTRERGDTVEIFKPVTPGKNVSLRGEDVKKGEAVLKAGKILRAHDLGMLASLFARTVKVYKRAKLGIIATGDELIDPTLQSTEHDNDHWKRKEKIADSNSYTLAALTKKIANPYRIGIVRDNYEEIKDALRSSLERGCEGLSVSGGSSVGTKDFLGDTVEELGELIFHGVAIRPGEPTGFGIINTKPIFVLPGYPVATIAAFELLIRPFLYAMHGVAVAEERRKILTRASKKIPSTIGRTDFVRVKVLRTEQGYFAEPIRVSGSGILSSMTKSDGWLVIPENKEGVAEGELVEVTEYEY